MSEAFAENTQLKNRSVLESFVNASFQASARLLFDVYMSAVFPSSDPAVGEAVVNMTEKLLHGMVKATYGLCMPSGARVSSEHKQGVIKPPHPRRHKHRLNPRTQNLEHRKNAMTNRNHVTRIAPKRSRKRIKIRELTAPTGW